MLPFSAKRSKIEHQAYCGVASLTETKRPRQTNEHGEIADSTDADTALWTLPVDDASPRALLAQLMPEGYHENQENQGQNKENTERTQENEQTCSPPSGPSSACKPIESAEQVQCPSTPGHNTLHSRVMSVLATERAALMHLEQLYGSPDGPAAAGMTAAVDAIANAVKRYGGRGGRGGNRSEGRSGDSHENSRPRGGGKVVVSGVGKSGLVGRKMAATMNSLGIAAVFVHPTDALHGDLGIVGRNDVVLLISYSGATVELAALVCHLPRRAHLIILSAHEFAAACPLLNSTETNCADESNSDDDDDDDDTEKSDINRNGTNNDGGNDRDDKRPAPILLPAPVPVPEAVSLGVAAPTASTTAALAVGDALALAVADVLHGDGYEAGSEERNGTGKESGSVADSEVDSRKGKGVARVFRALHPGGAIGAAGSKEREREKARENRKRKMEQVEADGT